MNRNQMVPMVSVIAVLIVVCAVLGYSSMANKSRALKAETDLADLRKVVEANLDKKSPSTTERRRVASAQPSMANPPSATVQGADSAADPADGGQRRDRGRESMERLKESDPERYADMVERRNTMAKQMRDNSAKQVDFFKKLDTKSMSPEQLANHNKLMPIVAKNNQLLYELAQNPDAENASDMRRELFENSRQMRDLMDTERSAALQQFAKKIGYASDQTVQFEDYVKHIYEMTSSNPFGNGVGFRGGTRGGQGGQGNR